MKIWRMWPSIVLEERNSVRLILVGMAFGHQGEHLPLAFGELGQRAVLGARA